MVSPSIKMQKKMALVLAVVFVTGFTLMIGRLVKLQFLDGDYYQQKAMAQQLSVTPVYANRGTIYDCNMKTLAQSATAWDVYVSPKYIKGDKKQTKEQKLKSMSQNLASILNLKEEDVYKKLNVNTSYVVISKKIENDTANLIKSYIKKSGVSGIGLVEDSKRYYPYGSFASQVIGFTGTDNQGLAGIEAYYNSALKGTNGRVVSAKNAQGTDMPYNYQDRVEAKNGSSLVLTIDEVVQHYLEKSIESARVDNNVAKGVTGIVMNVKTGEILGMATTPGYDPNNPYKINDATTQQAIDKLSENDQKTAISNARQSMWRNKAITDPYEPGSTFKIITAAAAMNENVVKESDTFDCNGAITVSGTTIKCWKAGGHGHQDFVQGFENSCNVVFITVGQHLGVTRFFKYFSSFGLTEKTGIDIPGEADSIYYTPNKMGQVELASCSFGQSNKITPIQLLTAVSAVANGGKLVQPHLVKEELDENGNVIKTFGTNVKRQAISSETAKRLCDMMQKEVSEGTGKNAYVAGYRIGGKTGTSQKLDDKKNKDALICSFVAIAPSDDAQIAVLLMLDEPHAVINFGGVIAAPVVGNLMSEILPYLGVEPKYTTEEETKLDVKTPNLVGMTTAVAQKTIKTSGLLCIVKGKGTTVTAQIPASGQAIPRNGTVVLYTGNEQVQSTVTVPNLIGMTPSQANSVIAAAGLNIKLVGAQLNASGVKSYSQSVAAETKVPLGTVITIQFRNEEIKVE